jgi:hypothetical protein
MGIHRLLLSYCSAPPVYAATQFHFDLAGMAYPQWSEAVAGLRADT